MLSVLVCSSSDGQLADSMCAGDQGRLGATLGMPTEAVGSHRSVGRGPRKHAALRGQPTRFMM